MTNLDQSRAVAQRLREQLASDQLEYQSADIIDALIAEVERLTKVDDDEYRCGGPGCDGKCCVPVTKADVEPIHQFRKYGCSDWYDGIAEHEDGHGPYEERELFPAYALAALQAENLRLAGEVASRNRRALEGDQATAALDKVHSYYEKLEAALRTQLTEAQAEVERLREALDSIAKNTCCDRCQEAAKFARAALESKT